MHWLALIRFRANVQKRLTSSNGKDALQELWVRVPLSVLLMILPVCTRPRR